MIISRIVAQKWRLTMKNLDVNDAITKRVRKLLDDSRNRTIATIVIEEEQGCCPTIRYNITERIVPEDFHEN